MNTIRTNILSRFPLETKGDISLLVFAGVCLFGGLLLLLLQSAFVGFLSLAFALLLLAWFLSSQHLSIKTALPILLASLLYIVIAWQIKTDEVFHIGIYTLAWEIFIALGLLALWPEMVSFQTKKDRTVFYLILGLWLAGMFVIKIPYQLYWLTALLMLIGGLIIKAVHWTTRKMCPEQSTFPLQLPITLGFMFIILLITNAWVSEDAYITLRTVDNFVHGHGLRWNIIERVQTYTHPLWMLILSAAYFVTREAYYTTLILNLVLTLAAVLLIILKTQRSAYISILVFVFFSFSKAFMDYSTSGLENALLYLILAAFFLIYIALPSLTNFLFLYLLAALAAFTRLDSLLIFIPAMIFYWSKINSSWQTKTEFTLFTFIPLFAWELFSLVYYGFLFPNTAYAKLNTGIPLLELMAQGLEYFRDSVIMDPLTLGVSLLAVVLPWITASARPFRALSLGLILYYVYLIYIGGDFMSGRFIAIPFVWSVGIVASSVQLHKRSLLFFLGALFLLSFISPDNPWNSTQHYKNTKTTSTLIADERGFYAAHTGLLNVAQDKTCLSSLEWGQIGEDLQTQKKKIYIHPNVGTLGFRGGPNIHFVDQFALTEPLLARLPTIRGTWRIGHFVRMLPQGYLATLQNGTNVLLDQDLGLYYEKLKLITQGQLFSLKRWKTIFTMNLGGYNHLINKSIYQPGVKLPLGQRYFLLFRMHERELSELLQAGIYAALADDWEKAAALWQQILDQAPNHYAALANMGIYHEQQGNTKEALLLYFQVANAFHQPWIDYYLTLRESLPADKKQFYSANMRFPHIRMYAEPAGSSEYDQLIRKGTQDLVHAVPAARATFLQAKSLDPQRPDAYANLGVASESLGELEAALKYYLRATPLLSRPWSQFVVAVRNKLKEPKPPELAPQQAADYQDRQFMRCEQTDAYGQQVELAIQSALKYDVATAEKLLKAALTSSPDRIEAKANLGIILEMQGKLSVALNYYKEAARHLGKPWTMYQQQLEIRLKHDKK
jgi:arabinofuranosyltransferase